MKRRTALVTALGATLFLALAAFVAAIKASPPSGVTPTILARGTYDKFEVKSAKHGAIDEFKAQSESSIDLVVRKHDYLPGSSTGWHAHPGPVFITVTQGQLTFYEADDRTCTPHVVTAGHGYVDSGRGHIGRNETDLPAQDVSVIVAPVGGVFRSELPAPNPNCGF
jgi:hypothetical protein